MNWRKLRWITADFVRMNLKYVSDGAQRGRLRTALKANELDARQRVTVDTEIAGSPPAALPYALLSTTSLALSGIRVDHAAAPHLNLAITEVREGGIFAGVHTALTTAKELADRLGLPLRVVMLDFTSVDNDRARAERFLRDALGMPDVVVVPREAVRDAAFGSRDVWLATHWKTAHAIDVACIAGLIERSRVAYLIQDYEPGFSAWSTDSVLAVSTYHAGFVPIINSIPLWTFLRSTEALEISRDLVFAPSFETERLRATAAARRPSTVVRVLFYGRPSKQRNLYGLGLSALKATARALGEDAADVEFYSAGELHSDTELGNGHTLRSLGRIGWDDYFTFLSTVQVMLSLQQSPHPSHPPFDAAISGATTITNDFGGSRGALHPRIIAVTPDTAALADAIGTAIGHARGSAPEGYLPVADTALGYPLGHALDAAIARLDA